MTCYCERGSKEAEGFNDMDGYTVADDAANVLADILSGIKRGEVK